MDASRRADRVTPVMAGVVTAVVGFTSSFAVVLAGLAAMGASPAQSASGLIALCVTMGVACIGLSWWSRSPITVAWSTPGAALLASAPTPAHGFASAVGAFVVCGALLTLTGLVPALARLVRAIPTSIASAMLAGVLLSLCAAPFRDIPTSPAAIGAVLVTWVVLARFAPRWAVPGALVAALVALGFSGAFAQADWSGALPALVWVTPTFDVATAIAIGLPLYLVTMTSQNIPGVAVLASFGYTTPWRAAIGGTGLGSMLGALFGGHAINLAAISAALAAGPEAGEDRKARWVAGVSAGVVYLVVGLGAGVIVAVAGAAPPGVFTAVAAVGLIGSLLGSLQQALADPHHRVAALVTVVVATSGIVVAGIGSAFWALAAGCVVAWIQGVGVRPSPLGAKDARPGSNVSAERPARG